MIQKVDAGDVYARIYKNGRDVLKKNLKNNSAEKRVYITYSIACHNITPCSRGAIRLV